jgi:regulator of sigma E protease
MIESVLITAAAFVFVLSVVVFVHEFGHFQVARWAGISVDTFSIGFGPKLLAWRDKQGVEWKIGALPLGGYVKFSGDADPTSSGPDAPIEDMAAARKAGFYHAMPVGRRAAVAAAGPIANFLFATLVFAALFMAFGRDRTDVGALSPRVDDVQAASPAAVGGLRSGDVILAVDERTVDTFGGVQAIVGEAAGRPLTFVVAREGERLTFIVTPKAVDGIDAGGARMSKGVIGVGRRVQAEERVVERLGPFGALAAGAEQCWRIVATTVTYIANIFSGKASAEHLAGPLGIMDQSGKVVEGSMQAAKATLWDRLGAAALGLVQWAAILSVAIGFVNLLPIPILDGGHLAFYAVEAVRGRPLSARAQEIGFRAGLAMVLSLFLFATWNDLQRLNVLEFLTGMLS